MKGLIKCRDIFFYDPHRKRDGNLRLHLNIKMAGIVVP